MLQKSCIAAGLYARCAYAEGTHTLEAQVSSLPSQYSLTLLHQSDQNSRLCTAYRRNLKVKLLNFKCCVWTGVMGTFRTEPREHNAEWWMKGFGKRLSSYWKEENKANNLQASYEDSKPSSVYPHFLSKSQGKAKQKAPIASSKSHSTESSLMLSSLAHFVTQFWKHFRYWFLTDGSFEGVIEYKGKISEAANATCRLHSCSLMKLMQPMSLSLLL